MGAPPGWSRSSSSSNSNAARQRPRRPHATSAPSVADDRSRLSSPPAADDEIDERAPATMRRNDGRASAAIAGRRIGGRVIAAIATGKNMR